MTWWVSLSLSLSSCMGLLIRWYTTLNTALQESGGFPKVVGALGSISRFGQTMSILRICWNPWIMKNKGRSLVIEKEYDSCKHLTRSIGPSVGIHRVRSMVTIDDYQQEGSFLERPAMEFCPLGRTCICHVWGSWSKYKGSWTAQSLRCLLFPGKISLDYFLFQSTHPHSMCACSCQMSTK